MRRHLRIAGSDAAWPAVVSARVAAELCGVSERTIRNWIASGKLPAVRGPQGWRIAVSDLEPFRAVPQMPAFPASAVGSADPAADAGSAAVLSEADRAVAMGAYGARLLEPVLAELRAAHQQIADLSAELGAERVRSAELGRRSAERPPARAPWWRRLWDRLRAT